MLVVPVYQIWKIFSLKAPPTRVWEIYALGLKGWNIMPGFPTIYIKDCFEKIYFLAKGLFFLIFWMWHCFRQASHLVSPRCWFIWKMHCFPTKLHKRSNYRGVRSLLKILMGLLQRSVLHIYTHIILSNIYVPIIYICIPIYNISTHDLCPFAELNEQNNVENYVAWKMLFRYHEKRYHKFL